MIAESLGILSSEFSGTFLALAPSLSRFAPQGNTQSLPQEDGTLPSSGQRERKPREGEGPRRTQLG